MKGARPSMLSPTALAALARAERPPPPTVPSDRVEVLPRPADLPPPPPPAFERERTS
jgi:hypothetical protein